MPCVPIVSPFPTLLCASATVQQGVKKILILPSPGSLWPHTVLIMPAAQVVSPAAGSAVGELVRIDTLASVQRERYSLPTVLMAQAVGGEEDIPEVCDCCCLNTASVVT